jgi:ligand-binding SRPBCC domain-containing protein
VLTLEVHTHMRAPRARCFDLARSIDLHVRTAAGTGETAVAGVTSGLIGPGQRVTWRGRHFGVWQELTSRITAYTWPEHFRDEMVQGAFRSFIHDHTFTSELGGTLMTDTCRFAAPFGPIGWAVERLVLGDYLRGFLVKRGRIIKRVAESDEWRSFLDGESSDDRYG